MGCPGIAGCPGIDPRQADIHPQPYSLALAQREHSETACGSPRHLYTLELYASAYRDSVNVTVLYCLPCISAILQ